MKLGCVLSDSEVLSYLDLKLKYFSQYFTQQILHQYMDI
jgi:hypothetical protein